MSFYTTWKEDIQRLGEEAGLEGRFCVDWGTDQLTEEIREGRTAQMENAALIELLAAIGNELFQVKMYGTFYAEQGESSVKHQLATRINEALGI